MICCIQLFIRMYCIFMKLNYLKYIGSACRREEDLLIQIQRPQKKYAYFVKQQPGRTVKQEEEELSRNEGHTISGGSVCKCNSLSSPSSEAGSTLRLLLKHIFDSILHTAARQTDRSSHREYIFPCTP